MGRAVLLGLVLAVGLAGAWGCGGKGEPVEKTTRHFDRPMKDTGRTLKP